jgi:penicillin-binding protein 2
MDRQDNNERSLRFTRRAFFIGGLQGALLAVLGGRLAWLQVREGNRYRMLSDENRINLRLLPPSRGQIVDRFGVPLAVNNQNFRVLIVPEQVDAIEPALRRLQTILTVDERDVRRVLKQIRRNPSYIPVEIRDNLSWEEVAKIEVNLMNLPGISTDVGELRSFPLGVATAHIVGYVGAVSEADQGQDPLLSLPGFRIGKTGIEKTHDLALRGRAGRAEIEVNVLGREVRELRRLPPVPGARVTLTVDAELQRFAQSRLDQEKSASAVVMDVHTGEIYALASSPGFDPNVFSKGITPDIWEEFQSEPVSRLNNKAVMGQYPPGSTFKMVTALAALEAGVINANTSVFCPGHYEYGQGKFHCWKKEGHGTVSVVRALAESCDVFFYRIATDLGIDRIAAMARKLGLGEKFDFELSEEAPGLVPDQAWKKKKLDSSWQPGETIVAAIGQGYMLATPLQLAVMTARLVNGGKAVRPRLTASIGEERVEQGQAWPDLGFHDAFQSLVTRGMVAVLEEGGTAYASRIEDPERRMGGKTGTAQVKRITMAERAQGIKNETLTWKLRHHALFVGFAPVHAPRYAVSVVVEHGSSGSGSAAPLARDLMMMTQQRNPSGQPTPPLPKKESAAP